MLHVSVDISHKMSEIDVCKSESVVHRLPCNIEYNGVANVNSFFKVETTNKRHREHDVVTSRFRGRKLNGVTFSLPPEVIGLTTTVQTEEGKKCFKVDGKFRKVTIWEHDRPPDLTDMDDAMLWMEIAKRVHS